MKKAVLCICAITFLATSCKKQKDPPPLSKSQWTVDGVVYNGIAKAYLGSLFEASAILPTGLNSGNTISISFNYQYWPTTSGIYKVKTAPADNSQCSMTVVSPVYPNSSDDFKSIDSNSEVSIVVSTSGKLNASFSNVVLSNYDGTQTRTASGTLEEQ